MPTHISLSYHDLLIPAFALLILIYSEVSVCALTRVWLGHYHLCVCAVWMYTLTENTAVALC